MGTVTCSNPLTVQPDDCSSAFQYDEVRLPQARQRCQYGAGCYRKNPVRKKEFAHPGDPDWDTAVEATDSPAAAPKRRQSAKRLTPQKGAVEAAVAGVPEAKKKRGT